MKASLYIGKSYISKYSRVEMAKASSLINACLASSRTMGEAWKLTLHLQRKEDSGSLDPAMVVLTQYLNILENEAVEL